MRHRVVEARDARIHLVEEGEGPVVLLVHGFPESWYSWRHQIPAIAEAGYRAVAIDVRGYGRSSAPVEVDAYGMLQHVTDNLGVLEALDAEWAVIVGHDWGSPIAADSALLRPDKFRAVGLLSVPYSPPGGRRPTDVYAGYTADEPGEEFYISYFQRPGVAEAEIELDVRSWLLGFYIGASGEARRGPDGRPISTVRRGGTLRERFDPAAPRPGWLSEADLDFYVEQFEYGGLRGPLNRYRNVDRDWRDLQPWRNRPIEVPALWIAGERDGPAVWGARSIERYPTTLPRLQGSHTLAGCGHWVQQERAGEVTELLVDWLGGLELTR